MDPANVSPCYRFHSIIHGDEVWHEVLVFIDGHWCSLGRMTPLYIDAQIVELELWEKVCRRIQEGS